MGAGVLAAARRPPPGLEESNFSSLVSADLAVSGRSGHVKMSDGVDAPSRRNAGTKYDVAEARAYSLCVS